MCSVWRHSGVVVHGYAPRLCLDVLLGVWRHSRDVLGLSVYALVFCPWMHSQALCGCALPGSSPWMRCAPGLVGGCAPGFHQMYFRLWSWDLSYGCRLKGLWMRSLVRGFLVHMWPWVSSTALFLYKCAPGVGPWMPSWIFVLGCVSFMI